MNIRNYNTKCYIPPVGEELQHDFCDDGISFHSDVTLLNRLSDMRLSQSLMDGILSRFTQIKDDMPQEIKDKFSTLDDFKKMEFTDSRYLQSLSDNMNAHSFIEFSTFTSLLTSIIDLENSNLPIDYFTSVLPRSTIFSVLIKKFLTKQQNLNKIYTITRKIL